MGLAAATRRALEEGRGLFNSGHFFEAHEVWEAAWLVEKGSMRQLLQGLIQVAAGFHQAFDRGRPSGCTRLLEAGSGRLETLPGELAGLDLSAFRKTVDGSLERARAWQRGEAEPLSRGEAPRLCLARE
jgi:predicted metal-dependent hydrolase